MATTYCCLDLCPLRGLTVTCIALDVDERPLRQRRGDLGDWLWVTGIALGHEGRPMFRRHGDVCRTAVSNGSAATTGGDTVTIDDDVDDFFLPRFDILTIVLVNDKASRDLILDIDC